MKKRTLQIRDVITAIRLNGYAQAYGTFVEDNDEEIYACAEGQAGLNLGVSASALDIELGRMLISRPVCDDVDEEENVFGLSKYSLMALSSVIVHLNDDHQWTLAQIADHLDSTLTEEQKNLEIEVIEELYEGPLYNGVRV